MDSQYVLAITLYCINSLVLVGVSWFLSGAASITNLNYTPRVGLDTVRICLYVLRILINSYDAKLREIRTFIITRLFC